MKGKILLCVLDWGLGHATRSLALARILITQGFDVEVASSGSALALLKEEMPGARFHLLTGYNINYPANASFVLGMIAQLGKIRRAIRSEESEIHAIVAAGKFKAIISDNRYGCHHSTVRSIFLSHHLHVSLPGPWRIFQRWLNRSHNKMINKFDECWVPDFQDHALSGDLSRVSLGKMTFVGPLSTMVSSAVKRAKKYELLAVLSGPEPQRTSFSELLLRQLQGSKRSWLLVHGLPGGDNVESPDQVPFMKRSALNQAMEESELIIARPGYSTVMDLSILGGRAVFVPTPGQTEQRYLADQLMASGIAFSQDQSKLNLDDAIAASTRFKGFSGNIQQPGELLLKAIATL